MTNKADCAWSGGAAAAAVLLLAGCAANPLAGNSAGGFDALYDGKAKIAYATQFPSASAGEAEARGDRALQLGDTDLALLHYVTALQLGDTDPDILAKIGAIHADRGNLGLAQIAYRMALKAASGHPGALEGYGLILLEARRHQDAEQTLARAVAGDGQRWRAYNGLGVIADLRGDFEQAAGHYAKALEIRPGSAQVLNNLGYSRYLAGDWEAAQTHLEKALDRDPRYHRAWMNLGLIFTRQGRYDDGFAAFRRVMDSAQAWNNVGFVCMMNGDYRRAEDYFNKAISLSPSYYASAQENLRRVRQVSSL